LWNRETTNRQDKGERKKGKEKREILALETLFLTHGTEGDAELHEKGRKSLGKKGQAEGGKERAFLPHNGRLIV